MKICFWIGSAYYRKYGTNKVASVITNGLTRHDIELVVTESNAAAPYEYAEHIKIVPLPTNNLIYRLPKRSIIGFIQSILRIFNNKTGFFNTERRYKLLQKIFYPDKYLRQLTDFFVAKDYDVIIAVGREILWLASIADKLRAKTIGWQHNSYDSYVNKRNFMFWKKEELLKKIIPNLDSFVMLNPYDCQEYKENLGIASTHISNPLTLQSDIKTDTANKQFIAAGRFVEQKGFDLLIDAFNIFCKYNDDWKLVIAGSGKLFKAMKKRAKKLKKIKDRIEFLGFTNDIQTHYLNSSIYLMTSRWEGWGLVVTEAFEMGLPVIAFDITPMDILIDNGENGVIVECFNKTRYAAAMLKLARDDGLRRKMHESAVVKAREYGVDKIIVEWEKLFENGG
ncbi:MAG: glycosyltransferase [Turicibacter sp.]|nr:glycosyltransferase [Turicibacter sp.]